MALRKGNSGNTLGGLTSLALLPRVRRGECEAFCFISAEAFRLPLQGEAQVGAMPKLLRQLSDDPELVERYALEFAKETCLKEALWFILYCLFLPGGL